MYNLVLSFLIILAVLAVSAISFWLSFGNKGPYEMSLKDKIIEVCSWPFGLLVISIIYIVLFVQKIIERVKNI